MYFDACDGYTLCRFTVFDRFPSLRAVLDTKLPRARAPWQYRFPEPEPAAGWLPPSWLSLLAISPERVARIRQIHGNRVVAVRKPGFCGEADGLVTDVSGLYLRVVTADCQSIFLYDPKVNCCGLLHAGWRGLGGGIVHRGVECMQRRFGSDPSDIIAAVGPFIQAENYEISTRVADVFPVRYLQWKSRERSYLDLGDVVKDQLIAAGISPEYVEIATDCTFDDDRRFHSYRRDGRRAGRMTAIFGMADKMSGIPG